MNTEAGRGRKHCQICGSTHAAKLRSAAIVRPVIADLIRRETGDWNPAGWVCVDDLQRFQHRYVEEVLKAEKGELTQLEQEVLESMQTQETLSVNADEEFGASLAFGERLADRMADFGGSWTFLMLFAALLAGWVVLNTYVLATRPFDPYPFILLNLCLSCLAAVQAPIIMMSQNRQDKKDRLRGELDYDVNRRAHTEIQGLAHKLNLLGDRLGDVEDILRGRSSPSGD
ncbi:MAG TPA: DUF1003 domain-containing protein [Rhodocyclaceae bacterium]|nr:DUF1003 domain-containing protein [Rhodocyclaceae bacterium]